jgi:flagellin
LKTAFDNSTDVQDDFEFTITPGQETEDISLATNTIAQTSLADGAAASTSTGTINLTAAATGEAANGATITLLRGTGVASPLVAVDSTTGNLTITVDDTANVTFADIADAINDEGTYTAVVDSTGGLTEFNDANVTETTTAFDDGVEGVSQTAEISLSALLPGTAANGRTITFNTLSGTTTPLATVDSTTGNITITVDSAASVSVASIVQAINDEGTYSATADTTGGLTSFNNATDTSTTNAFADGGLASGGLARSVVFELLGKTGSNVFNVSAGTSINDLVTQINLVRDATGVTASINTTSTGQDLVLTSSEYGSNAFVDMRVISEAAGGTIRGAIGAGARQNGTDIVAKVNGVDASGSGNKLSINTSTLELSLTVADGSDDNVGFTITGGGALFQLGADVVSNQQARIGIASVSAARLGGPAGKLFQLGSGESASLVNDPNTAARIVTEAINQVTSLRGRLGAFQATTLESNITSLSDTVANLQEAESTIRDADFAKESASLTRAQILVQSGTNVLALANQNPQNVLSLLR